MSELHFLTIAEASAKIRAKTLSPVELTQAYLARVKALDGQLNSHILVLKTRPWRRRSRPRPRSRQAAGRGRCMASRSR